jgi:hypothetical protein
MSSLPLQVYLFEDSILPTSHIRGNTATEANLDDERPGKLCEVGDAFIIRGGINDYIQVENDDTGDTVAFEPSTGGFGGDSWAVALATEIEAKFSFYGYDLPGMTGQYDETARKFTLSSSANTIIHWNHTPRTEALAATMGYDNTGPTASGTSHISDAATFVQDRQYLMWDIGDGVSEPEAFMLYSTNLSSTDTFYLYGNDTDLGSNPYDWADSATYRTSNSIAATKSEINDLYVWLPSVTGLHNAMRYWCLAWSRGGSQATMPKAKIGVAGMWNDSTFDGATAGAQEENFHTPWQRIPVVADRAVFPPGGGGVHRVQGRGHVEVLLPFQDWPSGVYRVIEALVDRHGVKPMLWVPDPNDLVGTAGYAPDSVFGVIKKWSPATIDNANDDRTFSILIRGIPMAAAGVI